MGIRRTSKEQWLSNYEEPTARIAAVRQGLHLVIDAGEGQSQLPASNVIAVVSRADSQLAELQTDWAIYCEYPYRRIAPRCPHCQAAIVALDARYCPRCERRLDTPPEDQLALEAA